MIKNNMDINKNKNNHNNSNNNIHNYLKQVLLGLVSGTPML